MMRVRSDGYETPTHGWRSICITTIKKLSKFLRLYFYLQDEMK